MSYSTPAEQWRVRKTAMPSEQPQDQLDFVEASRPSQPQTSSARYDPELRRADLIPLIQPEDPTGNGIGTKHMRGSGQWLAAGEPTVIKPTTQESSASPDFPSTVYDDNARSKNKPAFINSVPLSVNDAAARTRTSESERASGSLPPYKPSKSQPWKTALLSWWQELLWCIISIASVGALAGVLHRFDDKPLPEWPLGLTLNTLIALLATFARAAFIIPVSESLSQLKWLWYRKERPLKDFQDFDAASRGPWGSIQLVRTTKGWSPSIISMLVLVTAVLTSTLTQSTVTYPTRMIKTASKPSLPRSVQFYTNTANMQYYLTSQVKFDASIQAGLSYDYDTDFPFNRPRCPTTECHWDILSTLGICVKTWNVTEFLNVTYGRGDESRMAKFASLPNGATSNLSVPNMGLVSLNSGQQPLYSDLDDDAIPKSPLFSFSTIYSITSTIGAAEALFYFCVQRYNVSVHDNIDSRELVDKTAEAEYDMFSMPNHPAKVNLTGLKVPGEPDTKFPYGGKAIATLEDSLSYALNGSYSQISSPGSERGRAPSRYLNALDEVDRLSDYSGDGDFGEVLVNVTNNIARSLSNSLSDDLTNVTGDALIAETYVKVRWAWLSFISCQVALSIMVLAIAIVQTSRLRLGVVKSSTLPAFVAIDAQDREVLEKSLAAKKQQKEIGDVLKDHSGHGFKLGLTDRGWKIDRR